MRGERGEDVINIIGSRGLILFAFVICSLFTTQSLNSLTARPLNVTPPISVSCWPESPMLMISSLLDLLQQKQAAALQHQPMLTVVGRLSLLTVQLH